MLEFESTSFDPIDLEKYFLKKRRSKGFFKKELEEKFVKFIEVRRPFRIVDLEVQNESIVRKVKTFIDENACSWVVDHNQMLLLWRPRYSDITMKEVELEDCVEVLTSENELKSSIRNFIDMRQNAQDQIQNLDPDLRKLQSDYMSVTSFIIPRTTRKLKDEDKILENRKETHSILLASSLVASLSPEDVVCSFSIGERVYVRTLIASYKHKYTEETRIIVLENVSASSLDNAIKNGLALTRLCELNSEFNAHIQSLD